MFTIFPKFSVRKTVLANFLRHHFGKKVFFLVLLLGLRNKCIENPRRIGDIGVYSKKFSETVTKKWERIEENDEKPLLEQIATSSLPSLRSVFLKPQELLWLRIKAQSFEGTHPDFAERFFPKPQHHHQCSQPKKQDRKK